MACSIVLEEQSLREVDLDDRLDLGLYDLERQSKAIEAERNKLSQEFSQLQVRARRHEERLELARRENHELKQTVIDQTDIIILCNLERELK